MMVDFKKLYFTLFNRITDALAELEAANCEEAKKILMDAQITTEEMYIDADDSEE